MSSLSDPEVLIITYKRAEGLQGVEYFKEAKWVLPESQRDEYVKMLKVEKMIVIPDENDGNVVRKKNWILTNRKRPVLILNDDIGWIGYHDGDRRYVRLEPDEFSDWVKMAFDLAEEWGCPAWGINCVADPINYYQYRPISLTNMILGPFIGHLEHDCLYDESLFMKEDYDMCLQLLRKYKKILRLDKFHYKRPNDSDYRNEKGEGKESAGGSVGMRTLNLELAHAKRIMEKWGSDVIRYNLNPKRSREILNAAKVNVPIRGV